VGAGRGDDAGGVLGCGDTEEGGAAVCAAWVCDNALGDASTLVEVVGGEVFCLLFCALDLVPRMV
jgi:hypothetical protein